MSKKHNFYKTKGTEFYMKKSHDAFKRPHLIIKINNEEVFIPTVIITDFIEDNVDNISVTIPESI